VVLDNLKIQESVPALFPLALLNPCQRGGQSLLGNGRDSDLFVVVFQLSSTLHLNNAILKLRNDIKRNYTPKKKALHHSLD
jgi:hypothetical protein